MSTVFLGVKDRPIYQSSIQPISRLVINLKTAKALRLQIPESFLLTADKVIE
jgi:hypothetical protein